MDAVQIDIPTTVTAILSILVAVVGIAGKVYVGKALEGLALIADVFVDVGQLMITISKAGADGVLSPEEWIQIKDQARDIQGHLQAIAGKFGTLLQ